MQFIETIQSWLAWDLLQYWHRFWHGSLLWSPPESPCQPTDISMRRMSTSPALHKQRTKVGRLSKLDVCTRPLTMLFVVSLRCMDENRSSNVSHLLGNCVWKVRISAGQGAWRPLPWRIPEQAAWGQLERRLQMGYHWFEWGSDVPGTVRFAWWSFQQGHLSSKRCVSSTKYLLYTYILPSIHLEYLNVKIIFVHWLLTGLFDFLRHNVPTLKFFQSIHAQKSISYNSRCWLEYESAPCFCVSASHKRKWSFWGQSLKKECFLSRSKLLTADTCVFS